MERGGGEEWIDALDRRQAVDRANQGVEIVARLVGIDQRDLAARPAPAHRLDHALDETAGGAAIGGPHIGEDERRARIRHGGDRVEDQRRGAVDDMLGAQGGERVVAAALHGDDLVHPSSQSGTGRFLLLRKAGLKSLVW